MMSTVNPYIGNSTRAVRISTPVISASAKHCDDNTDKRRRRRATNNNNIGLTQGSVTLVDANIPPSASGLLVKATPKPENQAIAFSQFTLTSPAIMSAVVCYQCYNNYYYYHYYFSHLTLTSPGSVPVVAQVVPSQPSQVHVFIRRDALPSSNDWDWLLSWNDTSNYTSCSSYTCSSCVLMLV